MDGPRTPRNVESAQECQEFCQHDVCGLNPKNHYFSPIAITGNGDRFPTGLRHQKPDQDGKETDSIW